MILVLRKDMCIASLLDRATMQAYGIETTEDIFFNVKFQLDITVWDVEISRQAYCIETESLDERVFKIIITTKYLIDNSESRYFHQSFKKC